jgi:hypothetical protein
LLQLGVLMNLTEYKLVLMKNIAIEMRIKIPTKIIMRILRMATLLMMARNWVPIQQNVRVKDLNGGQKDLKVVEKADMEIRN